MRFDAKGENLTKEELNEIKNNFVIGKHAEKRLKERGLETAEIPNIISRPFLAYFNTDGTINIAKDEFHYLVFGYNNKKKNYKLITYKEPSFKKISVIKKQMYAKLGMNRAGSNRV